jgi:hypothetical protein
MNLAVQFAAKAIKVKPQSRQRVAVEGYVNLRGLTGRRYFLAFCRLWRNGHWHLGEEALPWCVRSHRDFRPQKPMPESYRLLVVRAVQQLVNAWAKEHQQELREAGWNARQQAILRHREQIAEHEKAIAHIKATLVQLELGAEEPDCPKLESYRFMPFEG